MSAVELFQYDGREVRTVTIDGEPWFVAADVARILGYRMASDMTRRLDPEDRGTHSARTTSGDQEMTVISEAGLYVAVIGSRVDGARAFKRWITHEVLPTIRRTGSYGNPLAAVAELTTEQWVTLAGQLTQRAEVAEARVTELAPAADAWAAYMDADGTYTLNAVAKIIGTGRITLMGRMRADGILTRDNLPMQRHLETGRFEVKVGAPWTKPDGSTHVSRSTRVTAKGLAWLAGRYGQAVSA